MTSPGTHRARGDGGQWDIVTSAGYTALAVTALRAIVNARLRPLDVTITPSAVYVALIDRICRASLAIRNIGMANPGGGWPEVAEVQMRFFARFCWQARAGGVRHVVIVAAGFDARAYRMWWPGGGRIFAVDQPQVLTFKSQVLGWHTARPKAHRYEVPTDLHQDLMRALINPAFDGDVETAWLADDSLIYLPRAARDGVFAEINSYSVPGSMIATQGVSSLPDVGGFGHQTGRFNPFAQMDVRSAWYDDHRVDRPRWSTSLGWGVSAVGADALSYRYNRPPIAALEAVKRAATVW
jgi:methyltransferase (TIGR00027 family)